MWLPPPGKVVRQQVAALQVGVGVANWSHHLSHGSLSLTRVQRVREPTPPQAPPLRARLMTQVRHAQKALGWPEGRWRVVALGS